MSIPSISIVPPTHRIEIDTVSGYAFMQEDLAHGFIPSQTNDALVSGIETEAITLDPAVDVAVGDLALEPDINVFVGIQTNSIIQQLLNMVNQCDLKRYFNSIIIN